jgi:uncharacterized membrane protein YidH (DUF202 family)
VKAEPDDPDIVDPASRTRLAWSRTAIAFAAIGAAMLKSSPVAGLVVLGLTVPVWATARRTSDRSGAIATVRDLRLVTVTVVLIAAAALAVAFLGHGPGTLAELLHGH